jgi:hypothetical protein
MNGLNMSGLNWRSRSCPGISVAILEPDSTEQADLHGGSSPWFAAARNPPRRDLTENIRCYALIVGAGITGSLVAERLTRQGLDVVKILGLKSKFFPSRRSHYSPCTILIGSLRSISRACRRDSDSMSFALT